MNFAPMGGFTMSLNIEAAKNELSEAGIQIKENPDVNDGYPNVYDEEQSIQSILTHLNNVYSIEKYMINLEDKLNGQIPEKISQIIEELKDVLPEKFEALINPKRSERFLVEGENLMFIYEYAEPIEGKVDQEVLRNLEGNTQSFLFRIHENLLLLIPIFVESTEDIYEIITGKELKVESKNLTGTPGTSGYGCQALTIIIIGIIAWLYVMGVI